MAWTPIASLLEAIQSPKPIKASTHRSVAQNIEALAKAEVAAFRPSVVGNYSVASFSDIHFNDAVNRPSKEYIIESFTHRGGAYRVGVFSGQSNTDPINWRVFINGAELVSVSNDFGYCDVTVAAGDTISLRADTEHDITGVICSGNPIAESSYILPSASLTDYTP